MPIKTDNMIFVFGSNLAGRHGAGAALFAKNHRDAAYGVGFGRTGQSYAVPTKDHRVMTMEYEDIQPFVDDFLQYAREHPELCFQVTQIGCGLAGLSSRRMANMFKQAPANCWFDNAWFPYLTEGAGDRPQHHYWGTI